MTGITAARLAVEAEAQPQPAVSEPPAVAAPTPEPNHYCLNKDHANKLVTVERLFFYGGEVDENGDLILVPQGLHPVTGQPLPPAPDLSKAPICPKCSAQYANQVDPLTGRPVQFRVSAVPAEYDERGKAVIPAKIMALAARIGE